MDCSFLSQHGKVVLVTGGSKGIGREIANVFADAGAGVAVCGRKSQPLAALVNELEDRKCQALAVTADIKHADDVERLIAEVTTQFGRIDVLVNNAATNPSMGPLIDTDEALFDQIMNTNLKGYFMVSRRVSRVMIDQQGGCIVNISSAAGVSPHAGLGPYSISKAGINMLTKALALELGPRNIRVNAIAPRIVKTEFSKALWDNAALMDQELAQVPLKRVATAREIAQTALFLASDAAGYMTGHVLVMNGGAFL